MNGKFTTTLVLLVAVLGAGMAGAQTHCSQLPPLTPETSFPRVSLVDLATVGFPDHMHAHHWGSWDILTDSLRVTYGPGSLCDHRAIKRREGLITEPDQKYYGQFVIRHNPGYQNCDMLPFIELLDWANHVVPTLLGLATADTLMVVSPDNSGHYKEMTGYGVWRLYALDGDTCILEPVPVLNARTLDGHAAFMLVTDWILQENVGTKLPPWLHQGIVEYMSEDGIHLINYMREFRPAGPILLSPGEIDDFLAGGLNPDEGTDREMFRRSCYSSFLMVWQLVEHEGGLTALQEFLQLAAADRDLDQASLQVYGMDLV